MSSPQNSRRPKIPPSQLVATDQIHDGETSGRDCDAGFFGITVKTFFKRCAGLVDAASVAVIDSCQGDANDPNNGIVNSLSKSDQANTSRRKQDGILEFPADGELQDDVSALSANTLEEMERLAKMMADRGLEPPKAYFGSSRPFPGQKLSPPSASRRMPRADFPIQNSLNDADLSIGIATSGSSSSQEEHERR